jgi:hypothetical protein
MDIFLIFFMIWLAYHIDELSNRVKKLEEKLAAKEAVQFLEKINDTKGSPLTP